MRYFPADYMQYGSTEDVKVLKFEQKFETQYMFNLTHTQPYTEFYGYYSFPTMITYLPQFDPHALLFFATHQSFFILLHFSKVEELWGHSQVQKMTVKHVAIFTFCRLGR